MQWRVQEEGSNVKASAGVKMVTALGLSELPRGCVRALTALGTFAFRALLHNQDFFKKHYFLTWSV